MPRYFLHLRRGAEAFLDTEGSEFRDLEALRAAALHDARDTMSWDIKEGRLDLRFRIEAEDRSGQVVFTLGFDEAVTILSPDIALEDC
ncbi:hypothetical protein [Brevundimonas sp. PAMC22021]|uniref:DUF6894 family protein n=1 Tax=Brevundimonas sp. PAMC22021 TaxID=2861285 RepID=UPI001C62C9C0|nr:hypothetical protein [Brevundimonas sp. PAMC22021]QYF87620.1 hypothetical protein KY493_03715 [Brevundimonas sp. PAMC22021]